MTATARRATRARRQPPIVCPQYGAKRLLSVAVPLPAWRAVSTPVADGHVPSLRERAAAIEQALYAAIERCREEDARRRVATVLRRTALPRYTARCLTLRIRPLFVRGLSDLRQQIGRPLAPEYLAGLLIAFALGVPVKPRRDAAPGDGAWSKGRQGIEAPMVEAGR
jgi:hypothetical protein